MVSLSDFLLLLFRSGPLLSPSEFSSVHLTIGGVWPATLELTRALRAKGLKVITNLRPVDSAEQYREMAVTLNLVGYFDGEFAAEGDQASATVYLRSGVIGMRSASTTFAGEKRTLAAEVGKGL